MGFEFGSASRTIAHPEGTRFAKPVATGCCWHTTSTLYKAKLPAPRSCGARARGKCLTCHAHRRAEAEARAFKAALESIASDNA